MSRIADLLTARPPDQRFAIGYGGGRTVFGVVERVDAGHVELRVARGWTKQLSFKQVVAIDGRAVEVARGR